MLAILVFSGCKDAFCHVLASLDLEGWTGLLLSAFIRMGATVCFFWAITTAPRIESTILSLTWPLFFVLLSVLFDAYKARLVDLLLLALSFIGASTIIAGNSEGLWDGLHVGYLMALASAFLGGAHSLAYRKIFSVWHLSSDLKTQTVVTLIRTLMGLCFMGLISLLSSDLNIRFPSGLSAGLSYAALGVFAYSGVQVLYGYALVKMDQITLSNIQYFGPIIVALALYFFVGDSIKISLLLGSILVFSSQYALHASQDRAN